MTWQTALSNSHSHVHRHFVNYEFCATTPAHDEKKMWVDKASCVVARRLRVDSELV